MDTLKENIDKLKKLMNSILLIAEESRLKNVKKDITNLIKDTQTLVKLLAKEKITDEFKVLVATFCKLQLEYKDKCKERVRRSIRTVHPGLSNEKVDIMMTQSLEQIFSSKSLESEMILAMETRNDLQNLEMSILELQELYQNMNILVGLQDIDIIEENTMNTTDNVESAILETKSAHEIQKKNRWILPCIILLFIYAILTLFFFLGMVFLVLYLAGMFKK